MRLLVCLLLSLVLAGCTAGSKGYYTQSVQSWRGGNANELLKVWGQPTTTLQNGGNITYVYKRQSFYSTNTTFSPSVGVNPRVGGVAIVTSTPNVNTPWNRGFAAYCLTVFTATPKGKIVDTNIEGSNCYVSQSKAMGLANPKK